MHVNLASREYTQTLGSHVIQWSQGSTTLGRETTIARCRIEKGSEPLDLAE